MSNPKPPCRRVFVECTHTYFVGGSSGIRRVARSLANSHQDASDERALVLPLVWTGRRFLRPRRPLTEAPHPLLRWRKRVRALRAVCMRVLGLMGNLALARAIAHLLRPLLSPLKRHCRALRCWLRRGRDSRDGFYRLFGLLAWPGGMLFFEPVRLRDGDIVVLVDSTWDSQAMLAALFFARAREGVQVGAMLHDLFPLTIPHMCQANTVADYADWFQRVTIGADFFITNSLATTRALQCHLNEHPPQRARQLPAGQFLLGAELGQLPLSPGPGQFEQLSGFVVLAVGTIEPRKNYAVILDALEMLWATHDVTLVIVGRPGWSNTEVMARIGGHEQCGAQIVHLHDADDAALNAAYQRADALVCASWAEGFGLPIVEGIRHGLPVVASDIESFREVGGTACRYFAPDRPQELATQLAQLMDLWLAGTPVRLEKCELAISWRESAAQFRDEVLRLAAIAAASRSTVSVSTAALSQE